MGGGSRSGRGATERKSRRWQGVVARWHSLGGSAPLPRTTRGPGRVGEASRSQTRCLHRSKGSRPEAMLSRATCVTPSRPCLLPGPRYCHPLALRTRCSSSWPGLCVARRGALRRTRRRAPEHATSANRTATQTATGSVAGGGAPSPASPRAPSACGSTLPQPLAGPPPPALRPACQAFRGTTHLVAPRCTGDRAGCRGDARPAGEGAPLQAARGGRAGSREKELGRGRGGAAELPSSSLPPGRDPAGGAVLGRGQRFFVSPAPSARHRGGGPHPGSGAGHFIRDINFSDYTRVRKRLNKL